MVAPSDHAASLRNRGYAVLEGLLSPSETAELRRDIEAAMRRLAPPALYAPETQPLGELAAITPTGLALPRLLELVPDAASRVLRPSLVSAMRETLDEPRVEVLGAVVSDDSRPFFRWHCHIDGVDEGERLRTESWPSKARVERVLCLLYLDDIDDAMGPLLVHPRAEGEPTPPPHDIDLESWPNEVTLRPRAGTMVALEQCTWHAARSRRTAGHRILVGCCFAAARATIAPWTDEGLRTQPLL